MSHNTPSPKSRHTGAYRRRPGGCRLEAGATFRRSSLFLGRADSLWELFVFLRGLPFHLTYAD